MDSKQERVVSLSETLARNESWTPTNAQLANQVISKYTGASSSNSQTNNNKRKQVNPKVSDEEYTKKRARNNIAVKKSREKAKNRILETQGRVEQLSQENEQLQDKVKLLTRELTQLRTLFTNGGFSMPDIAPLMNSSGSQDLTPPSMLSTLNGGSSGSGASSSSHYQSPGSPTGSDTNYETKIQPLKPMPRILSVSQSLKEVSSHSSSNGYSSSSYSPRESSYYSSYTSSKYPSTNYIKRETKEISRPPLLSPPDLRPARTTSPHYSSSTIDSQHTSVIRTTTAEISAQKNSLSQNSLGKFCIIKDPEGGQIKIVPLEN